MKSWICWKWSIGKLKISKSHFFCCFCCLTWHSLTSFWRFNNKKPCLTKGQILIIKLFVCSVEEGSTWWQIDESTQHNAGCWSKFSAKKKPCNFIINSSLAIFLKILKVTDNQTRLTQMQTHFAKYSFVWIYHSGFQTDINEISSHILEINPTK